MSPLPSHEGLVGDLRNLRERGLLRLRDADLPAILLAARLRHPGLDAVGAAERLLAEAVERLGEGSLGQAAAYTFGLIQGTRDWAASDRRRRAAQVYGVSVERFRKHQERLVLAQVAEQMLALCGDGGPAAPEPRTIDRARIPVAAGAARVTVQVQPIELVTGVDILVSPENVYLEMSKPFMPSVSGALRRTGAKRGPSGDVVDDVIQRELHEWMAAYGRTGLPVAPGTVAPTGPGSLSMNGVRRIYHVAVAVPRTGSNLYDVAPPAIALAVGQVFRLAAAEQDSFTPPLRSMCFPLIGTGRGSLALRTGLHWLWTAIVENLERQPAWEVHLTVPVPEVAEAVVRALSR
ncbi:hypothetical protein Aph01nite_64370 [Acrocarpospora phusangensis]|uniref:Macro domain-containing protein n=1 Tax=Acrocarpospora phusangensis TaxID=1070424 RepID=A0A919URK1_9ACTN|nr:hypothetical protein [Acrocarpospora phusangensis]GIH28127.1 hypothetical protein Aph01nite_64370 [Acrocarpospora phusangensis]